MLDQMYKVNIHISIQSARHARTTEETLLALIV